MSGLVIYIYNFNVCVGELRKSKIFSQDCRPSGQNSNLKCSKYCCVWFSKAVLFGFHVLIYERFNSVLQGVHVPRLHRIHYSPTRTALVLGMQ
jgi:hypothetical protein